MNNLLSFITSPEFLLYSKIIFISIGIILLAAIIILLSKASWLKYRMFEDWTEFFVYRPFGVKKTFKQWAKILKRLETENETEYKLAVIEADSLLDEILKKMGIEGEVLGEKLKQLKPGILPNFEEVRQAHKIRNNIVHDPDYRLNLAEAKKVISIYEQVFRDLEMF